MPRSLLTILGFLFIAAIISCNNGTDTPSKKDEIWPDAPKRLNFSVVNTFPHDTSSYTQGLVVYNGQMYEGTGNYGHSHLLKVDIQTGKILQKQALEEKYFGEGITILRDTIYQLTWREHTVFVYTLKDFKKVKEFKLDTEGWGITTDGTNLIVSDGTSNLAYYEPGSFKLLRTQTITEGQSLSYNLNELEYIDGHIFANQYQAPYIFQIDPATGKIVGKADVSAIWNRVKMIDPQADVPNGIAYDSTAKKIYMTGKLWPELYEIQFSK